MNVATELASVTAGGKLYHAVDPTTLNVVSVVISSNNSALVRLDAIFINVFLHAIPYVINSLTLSRRPLGVEH